MNYQQHKAMLAALAEGSATPEQQRAAHAHIAALKRQHAEDMREAERDARDAFHEGQADERDRADARYF